MNYIIQGVAKKKDMIGKHQIFPEILQFIRSIEGYVTIPPLYQPPISICAGDSAVLATF